MAQHRAQVKGTAMPSLPGFYEPSLRIYRPTLLKGCWVFGGCCASCRMPDTPNVPSNAVCYHRVSLDSQEKPENLPGKALHCMVKTNTVEPLITGKE